MENVHLKINSIVLFIGTTRQLDKHAHVPQLFCHTEKQNIHWRISSYTFCHT